MGKIEEFNAYRTCMNERILSSENLIIKRFFNLDTNAYLPGKLDVRTKEMIGLACSMVLRCDDCIKYHIGKCLEAGLTPEEIEEVFSIALVIGGSIVIPHLRRAVEYLDEFKNYSPQ
ncbi:MAG: carboxymuconolactone decarboxylase family protein [Bernardetiaceae bacterium]|nr:carboxymuconolactone decarboxylase family protein [Bernardetiaceae bacterium]